MHKLKPVTPGGGRNKGVAHSGLLPSDDRQRFSWVSPFLYPQNLLPCLAFPVRFAPDNSELITQNSLARPARYNSELRTQNFFTRFARLSC
jgi:hypothetical protein